MRLFQMSLASGVMILVIAALRALTLHRVPKGTFMVLWGTALVRLLIPFSLPSALSVYTLLAEKKAPALQASGLAAVLPEEASAVSQQAGAASGGADSVWTAVWAVGTVLCAAYFVVGYARCWREFQTSLLVENEFLRRWLQTHRLRRQISVRQLDRVSSALTFGVLRPVILLSKKTDWSDEAALRYVLEHEFVHIRRLDAAFKLAVLAAVCVHWYNPAVWLLYVLANRDMELACDEAVVRRFGMGARAAYAGVLIQMEEQKSGFAPLCSRFGGNAAEERIRAIMKTKRSSLVSIALAAALVAGTVTVFATSARDTAAFEAQQLGVGTFDAADYAPFGLVRDAEEDSYIWNGKTVRFFYDAEKQASFTNFYTGTVDLEAEYDENRKLTGVKECSQAAYDVHTKRYASSAANHLPCDAVETGNDEEAEALLLAYASYGAAFDEQTQSLVYGGKRIAALFDAEKPLTYVDDNGSVYLKLERSGGNAALQEISASEARKLLKTGLPGAVTAEEAGR